MLAVLLGGLPISAAVLSGNLLPLAPGTDLSLTTLGTLDWVHWGLDSATNVNRKSSVTPRIGALAGLGANPSQPLTTNLVGLSWTDGIPMLAVTNSQAGLFVQGLTNGFEISTEAGTERRRLRIFAGVEAATGLFEAFLSDASAPDYYDESLASVAGLSNGVFVLDFAAASAGQVLTVRFTAQSPADETAGRVLLQAVALASNLPPAAELISPTNNAVFFNSASITLTADASDSDGWIQGVEFYQGNTLLGEALGSPYTFQWDSVPPGNYSLTARAFDQDGASKVSAPVAVTVLSNFAPTAALTNLANYSSFTRPTNITLEARASDKDGTVAKVEFFANGTKLGEVAQSPYVFVWTNASVGEKLMTARATDNLGATGVSIPVDIFVTSTNGLLASVPDLLTEVVQLDAEGPSDWAHWGLHTEQSFDHKRGVALQIPTYSLIGKEPAWPYADNWNGYSWDDGTPIAAATNTPTGVYCAGTGNGFGLQFPAGTNTSTLKLYVGAWAARARLLAYLSDFSAPIISDVSVENFGNGFSTVYAIQYAAASAGKSLLVRYFVDTRYDSHGNVTLQAAALDTGNLPPSVVITNPPISATLLWPTNVTIAASAADADGSVTNVEFFRDDILIGQKSLPPYTLVWSNATVGSHVLTAQAKDNRGVSYTSRATDVFISIGGGSLIATGAPPLTQVDLTAEGTTDWAHWGLSRATSFDHKLGATTRISDWTKIGNGSTENYSNNFSGFSWTNGTPTLATDAMRTGVYRQGLGGGFQFTVPADPLRRRLRVYVGLYGARARFEAGLSDNSARPFVDTSLLNAYGNAYRVYTIEYRSPTPGKQLVVRHTAEELFDSEFGNVTLQAATLVDLPPPRLVDAARDGTAFVFYMTTLAGYSYQVQVANRLPATNWQVLETFPGTGAPVWITNSFPTVPMQFYRVMEY